MTDNNDHSAATGNFTAAKGGLFGGSVATNGLDPNTAALLMGARWTSDAAGQTPAQKFNYFFASSPNDFLATAPNYAALTFPDSTPEQQTAIVNSFSALSDGQIAAINMIFGQITAYTGVSFTPSSSANATIRFVNYVDPTDPNSSEARFPTNGGTYAASDARLAGDNFEGGNAKIASGNGLGLDAFATIAHELGHAIGLKHGHDPSLSGALSAARNDNEFSIMTYASYLGSPTSRATEAIPGSSPQSFMMYDIAALQAMYTANFNNVGKTFTYRWSDATGQETINDQVAAFTGTTATHKIFSTIWTGGATSTYDLSNFNTNGLIDLRPGQWLKFSDSQLADLNSDAAAGTAKFEAQGNIYNTLLYKGDTRSEISGVVLGNGNNTVTGNDLFNKIVLGSGTDVVNVGSAGARVVMGSGSDTVHAAFTSAGAASATIVDYSTLAGTVTVDLTKGTVVKGGVTDTLDGVTSVIGTSGADKFISDKGSDFFTGGGGNDLITGTGGVTTAVYVGSTSQYAVVRDGTTMTVTDSVSQRDGVDTLVNIAQIKFTDRIVVYDLNSAEDLLVYKVYQAALKRTPDDNGFRFWAQQADHDNLSVDEISKDFMQSQEFTAAYGANPTSDQFVAELYANVFGRNADAAGLAYWQNLAATTPREHLLALFALSAENGQIVGSEVANGFWTT